MSTLKRQQSQRAWYLRYCEERRAYQRRYYVMHKQVTREYKSKYRQENGWWQWWRHYQWEPLPTIDLSLRY